jgi:AcrR family transcriptional regulator
MSEHPSADEVARLRVAAGAVVDQSTEPMASPRERLLDAAKLLFCHNGINATGVDAIVAKAGTAKTTLYKIFGSKHKLVEAFLEREGQRWRRWFFASVDALPGGPVDRLAGVFDVLQVWFAGDDFAGCPFINAIGEHDKTDERLRMLAVRHKAAIDDYLVSIVHLAGLHDPESIINELGILIDGAIVAAMVSRRPEVALFAKSAFAVLLREHTDGRSLDRRPF